MSADEKKRIMTPEQRAEKLLEWRGLTKESYNLLLKSQNNQCAICGNKKGHKNGGRLVVDHCHKSGDVRGLLCHGCNRRLGMFKDSPGLVFRAANYLLGKEDEYICSDSREGEDSAPSPSRST